MDAIEYDAMMIRHHAAFTTGMLGWEGLLYVVAPTSALLEASMDMARTRKVTPTPRALRKARVIPRVESLDDMLARMG